MKLFFKNNNKRISLNDLKVNEIGVVNKVNCRSISLRKKYFDMGIIKGTKITISFIAPLNNPVSIKLRGYKLCLRREDLCNILVDKIDECRSYR